MEMERERGEGEREKEREAPRMGEGRRSRVLLIGAAHGADHLLTGGFQLIYPLVIQDLGLGVTHLGLVAASYEATAGLLQSLHGFLARRVRGGLLLGLGGLLTSFSTGLTSLATSFLHLMAARIAGGIGSSVLHPVGVALITEGIGKEMRGRLIGSFSSFGNLGGLLAPLLVGLLLVLVGWRATLPLIALPSLLLALILLLRFGGVGGGDRGASVGGSGEGMKVWSQVLRSRSLTLLTLATVLSRVYALGTYFPAFFLLGLGMDLATATLLFLLFRLGRVPGPFLFGMLSDRLGRKRSIVLSLLMTSSLLYLLTQAGPRPLLLAPLALAVGASSAAANVIIQAHIADSTPSGLRTAVLGVYFTLSEGMGALWTALLGLLISLQGFTFAFTIMALTSFLGGLITSKIRA